MEKLVEHLKKQHPYPEDVFLPITDKDDWKKFQDLCEKNGLRYMGFVGECFRRGYDVCVDKVERYID